ncbi:hypothetical protein UFOVP605_24 [uncultured Caudovirales phage]|uniref:Uncharacterized protein n=1 Tax=uncultured Caudovirales phage TaxID=2100421 RepID=A0A6J5NB38_9CAUD|nr:hypothetical protein UFOVP605_24 [uncultured Caudovirales phage]
MAFLNVQANPIRGMLSIDGTDGGKWSLFLGNCFLCEFSCRTVAVTEMIYVGNNVGKKGDLQFLVDKRIKVLLIEAGAASAFGDTDCAIELFNTIAELSRLFALAMQRYKDAVAAQGVANV